MHWIKKGRIFIPDRQANWVQTHAMLPTPVALDENRYRVFVSGRDTENRSLIGYFDIRMGTDEITLEHVSSEPVLTLGERGCFDDNGVTPSSVIRGEKNDLLYYIGWNSGTTTTRMSLIAGLASGSVTDGKFQRVSRAPLLQRTDAEPFGILTAPFVLCDESCWRMWYVSGTGWIHKDLPRYNIKYAESRDGMHWERAAEVAIDFAHDNETALARPWVVKEEDTYHMFFSYKDPAIGYRIGYAWSKDARNWHREDDRMDLQVSADGWDSEMIQ